MGAIESDRWREKQLRRILGHSQAVHRWVKIIMWPNWFTRKKVLSGCPTRSISVVLLRNLIVWLAFSSNLTLFASLLLRFFRDWTISSHACGFAPLHFMWWATNFLWCIDSMYKVKNVCLCYMLCSVVVLIYLLMRLFYFSLGRKCSVSADILF